MATPGKLSPEDEYRKLKGLGPDVPVPVSLESPTFPPDQARNLEMQRDRKPMRVRQLGATTTKPSAAVKMPVVETDLPPQGRGYKLYGDPTKHYGQQPTIAKIEKIADAFAGQSLAPVYVGNIGQKGGGQYSIHKGAGHRDGFGADIRPSDNLGVNQPVRWDSPNYNRTNTMMLIHEIRRQNPNAVILFNDPELIRMGLTKPSKGHDNHMHVDFK